MLKIMVDYSANSNHLYIVPKGKIFIDSQCEGLQEV